MVTGRAATPSLSYQHCLKGILGKQSSCSTPSALQALQSGAAIWDYKCIPLSPPAKISSHFGPHTLPLPTSATHSPPSSQEKAAPLTDGLGDCQGLRAVKGQVAEGPDDRVDLLHNVQGDGHNAAGVLAHSYSPTKTRELCNVLPQLGYARGEKDQIPGGEGE